MDTMQDAVRLRIYLGESDQYQSRPLYQLNGLLTLLTAKQEQQTLFSGIAQHVMRQAVYSVQEDAPIKQALELMIEQGIKRMVVTDGYGHLRGMIDRNRTLQLLGREKV